MINMGPKCGFVEKTPRGNTEKTHKTMRAPALIAIIIASIILISAVAIYAGSSLMNTGEMEYRATATHIVINEVYYDAPTGYSEPECEWIELYNPTSSEVNISGWKLADGPNDTAAEGNWTFPTGTTIPAGGYLLIVNDATYKGQFNTLFPGVTPDFDTNSSNSIPDVATAGSLSLANSGDDVHLFDSSGTEIDAMWYGNGGDMGSTNAAPDVASGHSLARYYNAEDTDNPSNDFYDENNPTSRAQNSEAIPELTPGTIIPLLIVFFIMGIIRRKY